MSEEFVAFDEVCDVTDQELIVRLRRLARADRLLNVRLIVHLGEVDARGLYREQAHSSMYSYCVSELRMSESEAYLRIQAARLARQFPRMLQLLAEGALHLTAIKLLGPHLTAENHAHLLERASGKGKREIELIVAEIAPKPDVPSRIRKLPVPRSTRGSRPAVMFARGPAAVGTRQAPFTLEAAASAFPSDARQPLNALPDACDPNRNQASLEMRAAARSLSASHAPFAAACAPNRALFLDNPSATQSLDANPTSVDAAGDPGRAASLEPSSAHTFETSAALVAVAVDRNSASALATRNCASDASDSPIDCARASNGASFALEAPRQRGWSKPLSPGRYKVEFTAGQALRDKLVQLQDLLRHQVPDGELAVIVERAVDLLIEDTLKQRFAQTRAPKKPRAPTGLPGSSDPSRSPSVESSVATPRRPHNANSRYIPRAVVREVHQRDAGQCTFVSSEGKRCSERGFLELHHHDQPYARGGKATVENLRLVCRAHNALFAERDYGMTFMRAKQKQAREAIDRLGSGTSQSVSLVRGTVRSTNSVRERVQV